MATDTMSHAGHAVEHQVRQWVPPLARFGYAAKGLVYGVVGLIAVKAAIGGGQTKGPKGAIATIAEQPFGELLLWLVAIGLVGFVVWRLAEAFLDAEAKGAGGKGLAQRAGYFISALAYGGLAASAAMMALGSSSGQDGQSQQAWTATVMEWPGGRWLVGVAGLVAFGVGIHQFLRAYKASFMKELELGQMSEKERTVIRKSGRLGLSARGVTFCIIGGFVVHAAKAANPNDVKGLDVALATLAEQPFGKALLGVVAVGLIAYGVYSLTLARYRSFKQV